MTKYHGLSDSKRDRWCLGLLPDGNEHDEQCNGEVGDLGNATFYWESEVAFGQFTDGLSNTIIVGERGIHKNDSYSFGICAGGDWDSWISMNKGIQPGNDYETRTYRWFWSYHPANGVNFLRGDGSVVFMNEDTSLDILQALTTIAGEEVVGEY